ATLTNLTAGTTYYFVVTARNASGVESVPSNEVSYKVPTSPNQPPTLNALSNVTISEDAGAQTIALSGITDGSTAETQTLTVTATSSNPGLIANPAVSYTSPNTTGSILLVPAANSTGTAVITVSVNDGQSVSNVVNRSFTVTVVSVNDWPTLN